MTKSCLEEVHRGIIGIDYVVKDYVWGKDATSSLVYHLFSRNNQKAEVSRTDNDHFAEIWMGTHQSGPSKTRYGGKLLKDCISSKLNFMFKVLSIQTPLSIQVHPNASQAAELHKKNPVLYPDSNPKPEIAVALTKFGLLLGFRCIEQIQNTINCIGTFRNLLREFALINEENVIVESINTFIRQIIQKLFHMSKEVLRLLLDNIKEEIERDYGGVIPNVDKEAFSLLHRHYNEDFGCIFAFLMNYVILEPEESVYIPVNTVHSYLYGDCLEIMTESDNVIRAGLTSKNKDLKELMNIVNLNCTKISPLTAQTIVGNDLVVYKSWSANVGLEIQKVMISPGEGRIDSPAFPSFLLCLEGSLEISETEEWTEPMSLCTGNALYVEKDTHLYTKTYDRCVIYRAFCSLFV